MREFDITCTATLRPELLRRTFMSHTHNLFKEDISNATLHINIDYVGGENKKDCAKRLDDIFQIIDVDIPFRNINVNVSYDPDFSKAFFWCMDQIRSTDLFFHLEEDWELNLELDWGRMVGLFDEDQRLAHLRLSAFPSTSYRLKNWNKFNDWNGGILRCRFAIEESLVGLAIRLLTGPNLSTCVWSTLTEARTLRSR
jgi:hypothetical protein